MVVTEDLDDDMRNTGALADGSTAGAVVAHLAELGHRHFLHVAGDPSYASARNRARAYQEAVVRLGHVSHGVVGHSWSADTGYTAVQRLADATPVTAVITANDTAAFGPIRAAFDHGWLNRLIFRESTAPPPDEAR